MNKKLILSGGLIVLFGIGVLAFFLNINKTEKQQEKVLIKLLPSATLKDYTDSSGFSFTYPDNLSITKNDPQDGSVYADIQLNAADSRGGLHLKIADSKFTSIDQWAKGGKEVTLGSLKAQEIKDNNKILLGALDQGVLFTIEVTTADQEEYWTNVYNTVRSNFSFNQETAGNNQQVAGDSFDDVTFEGEETVGE